MVKNVEQLMDALGSVNEDYILEAAPGKSRTRRPHIRRIAVAAAIAFLIFVQTPPGVAALARVREAAASLIEIMFPPKKIVVQVEGDAEARPHEAAGQAPDAQLPGFVIYYDTERYQMTEEQGATYIRPIRRIPTREEIRNDNKALLAGLTEEEAEAEIDARLAQQEAAYAALPVCEMEIVHLADTVPADAARKMQEDAVSSWTHVTEVEASELPEGYQFRASAGDTWDAPREQVYLIGDGQDGAFRVVVRYFEEATEGHRARFLQMLQTFQVLEAVTTPA